MPEEAPNPGIKEAANPNVDLEYQKRIIEVVLHESERLTLHPLIDHNSEIGLTHGAVFKNPKSERKNDYRAVVIVKKKVKFLDFESSQLDNASAIRLLSRKQRNFTLSKRTKEDLLQVIKEIQNGAEIEREPVLDVYKNCQSKVSYYFFHSDTRWHIFLTCWLISTYCHPLFSPYAHVALKGVRGTGKSATVDLAYGLSYNPQPPSSTLRAAPLFRKAEATRGTMMFDLTKVDVKDPDVSDIFEIIDKTGVIERCLPKSNIPISFRPLCPKLVAARYTLPFSDKTIVIPSEAPPDKATLKVYTERRHEMATDKELAVIASNILRSVICHWQEILDAYNAAQQDDFLYGRRFELWRPFLAVCKVYAPDQYEDLLALAHVNAETATKGDVLSDVEESCLGYLQDWRAAGKSMAVKLKDLTKHCQEKQGNTIVRNYRIVQSAMENLHVIKKTYKTSDGITYEVDLESAEKVAADRGVLPDIPMKDKGVRCHECGKEVLKDEAKLTTIGHTYCNACLNSLILVAKIIVGTSTKDNTAKTEGQKGNAPPEK